MSERLRLSDALPMDYNLDELEQFADNQPEQYSIFLTERCSA